MLFESEIAEAFSDESASRHRIVCVRDWAVVATNKIKNGAVNFSEFSRQMIEGVGEVVRPKLRGKSAERISIKLTETKIVQKSIFFGKRETIGEFRR